jgi:hypothetical protein
MGTADHQAFRGHPVFLLKDPRHSLHDVRGHATTIDRDEDDRVTASDRQRSRPESLIDTLMFSWTPAKSPQQDGVGGCDVLPGGTGRNPMLRSQRGLGPTDEEQIDADPTKPQDLPVLHDGPRATTGFSDFDAFILEKVPRDTTHTISPHTLRC